MYFQLVKNNRTGRWHARIRGDNHEIVFSTQTYDAKSSAVNAVAMVQSGAATAKTVETEQSG
jgi:uncharacterized protein YegP (UPF0339 family)